MLQEPSRLDVGAIARSHLFQAICAVVILVALLAGTLVSVLHGRVANSGNSGNSGNSAISPNVAHATPEQRMHPSAFGPLVSRDKPVVCSKSDALVGGPHSITSGLYGQWSFWGSPDNQLPSWCSIHIGVGPSRLMVAWFSDYDEDQARYISNGRMPQSYTLSVSANSTNGSDGDWKVVATITGNPAHIRESVIPFAGDGWVRMTITQAQDHPTQDSMLIDQIDCWDVSASLKNTALFEGDSITSLSFDHATGADSFDMLMHAYDSRLFPSMLNEGMGGWTSDGAVHNIDKWLALNPDVNYWLLEWGTNDAFAMEDPAVYRANMQIVIDKIKAAGHVPVLAQMPPVVTSSGQARLTAEIQALNRVVVELTQANHLIPGPDLFAAYGADPSKYVRADGIHPNGDGAKVINHAWYLAMRDVLKANV